MAGTKKSSKTSNKARGASPKPQNQGDGIATFLIPTGHGTHAYIRDAATGQNPLLKTSSEAFTAAVGANTAAGHGAKVRAEIESFTTKYPADGWDGVLARLDAADAFAA